MKEMILHTERLEREARLAMAAASAGVWMICVFVVWIVALVSPNPSGLDMVPIGTLCFIMVMVVIKYFSFQNFLQSYQLAVSMGRTRHSFLISHLLLEIVSNALMFGLVYLLCRLELFLYEYMGIVRYEFTMYQFFEFRWIFSMIAVISVLNMFIAAVSQYKIWIPSILWILFCLFIGREVERIHSGTGMLYHITQWITNLPAYGCMLLFLVLSMLLWGISWNMLYKKDM